jgi:hypothetical protein
LRFSASRATLWLVVVHRPFRLGRPPDGPHPAVLAVGPRGAAMTSVPGGTGTARVRSHAVARESSGDSANCPTLARLSLPSLVMLLFGVPSCLVTSSPDFTPPERTRPEIVANDAYPPSPALGELALFRYATGGSQYTPIEFSAWVQSEDAGQAVQVELLIDYGDQSGVENGPYRSFVEGEPLAPASMSDGPREVAVGWRPQSQEPIGCHTVTLLTTHQYAQRKGVFRCPADPDDASMLTWFALVCGDATTTTLEECYATKPCPVAGLSSSTSCAAAGVTP